MYALDHPDQGKFVRPGARKDMTDSVVAAAWDKVLEGNARHEMMAKRMPSEATLKALRQIEEQERPRIIKGPAQ